MVFRCFATSNADAEFADRQPIMLSQACIGRKKDWPTDAWGKSGVPTEKRTEPRNTRRAGC
jgi:hypothetical protein